MRKLVAPIVAVSLLALPGVAFGHAKLMATAPANGQTVSAPGSVTVVFDDIVQAPKQALVVRGPSGHDVVRSFAVVGQKTLAGTLEPNLAGGTYAATWKVVADDGHLETGTFHFKVQAGAGAASSQVPPAASTTSGGKTSTATILVIAALAAIAMAALAVAFVRARDTTGIS